MSTDILSMRGARHSILAYGFLELRAFRTDARRSQETQLHSAAGAVGSGRQIPTENLADVEAWSLEF